VAIAAGYLHNLALKADGTVVGWGYDGEGETDVPAGLSNVVAVAAGAWHSLALKNDGTLVAWGDNSSGQANLPAGLRNVAAMAGGGYHSLALIAGPPWIIAPPQSQIVCQGSTVTFRVVAAGLPPSYQWQFNGTNLAGARAGTLTLTNVQFSDAGNYSVTLTNLAGVTNSAAAVLTVINGPALVLPCMMGNGAFSCLLVGEAGRNYLIEVTTDFVTWTPLTTLSNATGQAPITDTNATGSATSFYRARLLP
jgi:hypothetical protein